MQAGRQQVAAHLHQWQPTSHGDDALLPLHPQQSSPPPLRRAAPQQWPAQQWTGVRDHQPLASAGSNSSSSNSSSSSSGGSAAAEIAQDQPRPGQQARPLFYSETLPAAPPRPPRPARPAPPCQWPPPRRAAPTGSPPPPGTWCAQWRPPAPAPGGWPPRSPGRRAWCAARRGSSAPPPCLLSGGGGGAGRRPLAPQPCARGRPGAGGQWRWRPGCTCSARPPGCCFLSGRSQPAGACARTPVLAAGTGLDSTSTPARAICAW